MTPSLVTTFSVVNQRSRTARLSNSIVLFAEEHRHEMEVDLVDDGFVQALLDEIGATRRNRPPVPALDMYVDQIPTSLDPELRVIAALPEGPTQIIAPAGSGKTTTNPDG